MAKIDPARSWACFDERLASETNPVVKGLITEVRNHMQAEITGQIEPLMATLTEHPVYHFWAFLPEAVLDGYDMVRGFYTDMMGRGGEQFEVVTQKIIADEGGVITEGQVKQLYLGEDVIPMLEGVGKSDVNGEPVDPSALYLATVQLITAWPNDGKGKLVGEDIYFAQSPTDHLEKITHDDLAPDFEWNKRFLG